MQSLVSLIVFTCLLATFADARKLRQASCSGSEGTLRVNGAGFVDAQPDVVTIIVAINGDSESAVSSTTDAVKTALTSAGIPDANITTQPINQRPTFANDNGPAQPAFNSAMPAGGDSAGPDNTNSTDGPMAGGKGDDMSVSGGPGGGRGGPMGGPQGGMMDGGMAGKGPGGGLIPPNNPNITNVGTAYGQQLTISVGDTSHESITSLTTTITTAGGTVAAVLPTLSDSLLASSIDAATKLAIEDAKTKASSLASAAGIAIDADKFSEIDQMMPGGGGGPGAGPPHGGRGGMGPIEGMSDGGMGPRGGPGGPPPPGVGAGVALAYTYCVA